MLSPSVRSATLRARVVTCPSTSPQQNTACVVYPHVREPDATRPTSPAMSPTEVGRSCPLVDPSPSCPRSLAPQHKTPSDPRSTQVWREPAAIIFASARPRICTGSIQFVRVRLPSCPSRLAPQQTTELFARTAQVWSSPATIVVASVRPRTGIGRALAACVPVPSCPSSLAPQQTTSPDLRRAQLCDRPSAICCASPRPCTVTGVLRSVVVPSPSCPAAFAPQHDTDPDSRRTQVWPTPDASELGFAAVSVFSPAPSPWCLPGRLLSPLCVTVQANIAHNSNEAAERANPPRRSSAVIGRQDSPISGHAAARSSCSVSCPADGEAQLAYAPTRCDLATCCLLPATIFGVTPRSSAA